MKPTRFIASLAGASALAFVLSGSKCETSTDFPPYVAEICNDNIDNDGDGLIDCKDPDCNVECQVKITLSTIISPVRTDSITISGTQLNAASISVAIVPSGLAGAGIITGSAWQAGLTHMLDETNYTVTVVATDSNNKADTVTSTFIRKN